MATPNTQTLIATFNDYSTARQAARELIDNGIPSDAVNIDSNQKSADAESDSYRKEEHHTSGFMEWWNSLFGADHENEDRQRYEGALAGGSTILRATVPSESVNSAVDVLNRYDARDIETDRNDTGAATSRTTNGAPIEVVEEELNVGKRAVQRGGVRVYSHVVNEPVEEQVRLREEHVNVERRPVDRAISPEEVSALRDQTIEVTEMAEEVVVGKRARVREEVVVGKEATERTETVRDNVRRTEVEVEQLGRESNSRPVNTAAGDYKSASGPNTSLKSPAPGVQSGFGTTAGAGTLAGEATAGSAIQDFPAHDLTSDYRRDFEQNYGSDSDFNSMRPAYEYGYRNAGDPRYRGKSWDQVENDIRSDYERTNPGSSWEKAKNAIRYGWDKVTGKV